jgi:hypothetical protein
MPAEASWLASLPLLGRSFLVLGGAFLIRALTDGGMLPRAAGIALGLAYAAGWVVLADRAAARGRRQMATFLGATAVLVAAPLAWEAATRFRALPAAAAVAIVAVFTASSLAVAWRRDLPALAWIVTLAALAALLALLVSTRAVAPVSVALLLFGAATAALAYGRRRWHGLRWPVAAVTDFVLVLMTWLVTIRGGALEPARRIAVPAAFWLALALPVVYLSMAAVRTLARRRDVTPFEALQSVASLLVGVGGAAAISRASGSGEAPLGVAGLLLAAACYAVAFAFVERRAESGRNFLFYASLAIGLVLSTSSLVLKDGALSAFWSVLGVATAVLGAHFDRKTLRVHAAVYLAAAALASGLASAPFGAFLGPAASDKLPFSVWGGIALAASAVSWVILAGRRGAAGEPWHARLPALVAALLTLGGAGALGAWMACRLATDGRDPGSLAAARTAVLSLCALALAAAWRRKGLRELRWLANALLAATAAKLLLQDVPNARPATLVAAFAFYGLALTFAPRWLRGPVSGP